LGGKRRISVEEKEMVDLWPEVERLLAAEAEAEGMKEAEETTAILEWKFVRMDFD
jgi:phage terminase Nu1 subunit (DNA packaging protein)